MTMPVAHGSSGFATSHPSTFRLADEPAPPVKQRRRTSLVEAFINVLVGYGVALVSQILVFPLFGIHATLRDNILIGLLFTVISVVRSYCLRRVFEWLRVSGIMP